MAPRTYLLSGAQGTEVLGRPRHGVLEELQGYAPDVLPLGQPALRARGICYLDVEEHSRVLGVRLPHFFLSVIFFFGSIIGKYIRPYMSAIGWVGGWGAQSGLPG